MGGTYSVTTSAKMLCVQSLVASPKKGVGHLKTDHSIYMSVDMFHKTLIFNSIELI